MEASFTLVIALLFIIVFLMDRIPKGTIMGVVEIAALLKIYPNPVNQ